MRDKRLFGKPQRDSLNILSANETLMLRYVSAY